MAIDLNQFGKTLTYTITAPVSEILADLQTLGEFDRLAEKKHKQFTTILVVSIIGSFISFFLFAIAVGFATLPICLILAIYSGIMVNRYNRRNIPNYRYEVLQKLLPTLCQDMDAQVPLNVHLALSSPTEATKKIQTTPHPHRHGWKIDHFRDPWLTVQGVFLDGTRFNLAATALHITQYGWKRGRSGKSKFKKKSKEKGQELEMTLTCSRRKYGALSVLKQDAIGAIRLPEAARLRRFKVSDNDLYLKIKTPAWIGSDQSQQLHQAITMMFLSLYQILNLARLLSKKANT